MEGTETGSFNEMVVLNGVPLTEDQQLAAIKAYGGLEVWGSSKIEPHYAAAWAWAGNTPFQWGKQVASHLGGVRNPMVVSWPKTITDKGGLRGQFVHVHDIAPTLLAAAGAPEPRIVDGAAQTPMHGVSFLPTFTDAGAPSRHTQQYFEVLGNRAMYKDGWWLACRLPRIPWKVDPASLAPFAPGRLGSGRGSLRALRPDEGLLAVAQSGVGAPRQGGGAARPVLARGGALPGFAAARRTDRVLRDDPADSDPIDVHVLRRCPERRLGNDPADLQPLLHDQRRPRNPAGRRGRRNRGRGRPPRRLLALHPGRQSSNTPTRSSACSSSSRSRRRRFPPGASTCAWSSPPTRRSPLRAAR